MYRKYTFFIVLPLFPKLLQLLIFFKKQRYKCYLHVFKQIKLCSSTINHSVLFRNNIYVYVLYLVIFTKYMSLSGLAQYGINIL